MKERLKYVAGLVELVFYITFYSMLALWCFSLIIIIPCAFFMETTSYIDLTDRIFSIFDRHKFWMIAIFLIAGVYSIGRCILNELVPRKKSR